MSDHDNDKKSSWLSNQSPIQRKAVGEEYGGVGKRSTADGLVNRNVAASDSWLVQRWRDSQGGVKQNAADDVQRAASDSGSPLPEQVRGRFESSLGTDLSGVRVHTGSASAAAAKGVGAKAYTTGQDIHFAAGAYDASSRDGQRLLAHEVAHTVQQSGTASVGAQFKLEVSQPGDAHEAEADQAADAMISGARASVAKGTATGVLAREAAEDACNAPDAPLVCAPPSATDVWSASSQQSSQTTQPLQSVAPAPNQVAVPAPFDIPVADQCMLPPPPRDWSQTPGIGECPMEPLVGGPGYKPEYIASNLDTYKSAFNTSWSELQGGYNVIVDLNRSYKLKEKEIIPLLHVGDGVVVSGGGQNATKSFDGDKLKPGAAKLDSEKVSAKPGLREQLIKAKAKISSCELAVTNQRLTAEQANGEFLKACNSVDQATNSIEMVKIDQSIASAQLDKDQVKRDLEDYKADIKAMVEGAKMASALWSAWANPTKIFDAFNQTMNAGGALAERSVTQDANKKLAAIDRRIGELQTRKFNLQLKNAMKTLDSALIDMQNKLREVQKQSGTLKERKQDYELAYLDMAGLMSQAGSASGMKSKDAKALAAAVEAMPKIEAIAQQLEGMEVGVAVPKYNEAAGIGAAMSSNLSAFTHALSVVKGNNEYIAELKAVWEGRKASVQMAIEKALSVDGAEW